MEHSFTQDMAKIYLLKIIFKNEYFFYISDQSKSFEDLTLLVQTKFDELPLKRNIMWGGIDMSSKIEAFSQMLCKKLEKPIYFSCSLKSKDVDYNQIILNSKQFFLESI